MKRFSYFAELVDPRSHDGGRFSYQGMTVLPVSYECDWMTSSEDLQRVVDTEIRYFVNPHLRSEHMGLIEHGLGG